MAEERLEGGYADGAVRVGDTVRRPAGPWTPAVHALLAYLADHGFTGAPRPLGFDEQGRGTLTGFFDWDFAGPATPEWDLALAAFTWVPLLSQGVPGAIDQALADLAGFPR